MNHSDCKYMVESISADLAELLTHDYGMSITDALDTLYNSETYAILSNYKTGLYFQSSLYVYSFLKSELSFGKLVWSCISTKTV